MTQLSTVERRHVTATPDGRLTRREAAKYLGVAERTLANWKSRGVGPALVRVGGRVFYKDVDLANFVEAPPRNDRLGDHR